MLLAVTALGISVGEAQPLAQAHDVTDQIIQNNVRMTWSNIFFNNWFIALVGAVPFAGWFYTFNSWLHTGVVLGLEAHVLYPGFWSFAAPFGMPFLYPESFACALLVAESLFLAYAVFVKRTNQAIKDRLRGFTWKSLLAASLVVLVSALVEWVLIAVVNGHV